MWSGTAGSFVDLHPEGAFSSKVVAANADWLVGSVRRTSQTGLDDEHITVWNAQTLEMIDLHYLLPAHFQDTPSWGTSIDELGNIGGVFTSTGATVYGERAAIWTVPEPTALLSLGLGLFCLLLRKRSRKSN